MAITSSSSQVSPEIRVHLYDDVVAALTIDLAAMVMTAIMIYHIKSKYTAVGRKEMVIFFYAYFVSVLLDFLLISNIVPFTSAAYKVRRAPFQ